MIIGSRRFIENTPILVYRIKNLLEKKIIIAHCF